MHSGLAGRHAVVTGGGRGIGAAVARALASAGARVTIAARTTAEVDAIALSIRASGGSSGADAFAVSCDIATEAGVRALVDAATSQFGDVDILVNNAGIGHSALVHQTTLDDWNRVIAVNATAPFLCTRALLPSMTSRGWGRIVNIASMAGLGGARYIAAYTASKHALVGLTRAVAAEVAATGVTCNAICPAFVDTPMTAHTIANVSARTGKARDASLDMVLSTSGQARLVTPEEVAHAVLFLCDVDGGAINGDTIAITGGGAST